MELHMPPRPDAAAIQRVFEERIWEFETVEVAGLPCDDRQTAERLSVELREGRRESLAEVPTVPEILEEPAAAGYFGLVTRADLPPEFAEALFRDGADDIVGPVAYAGRFWVFQILMPKRAEITQAILDYCEALLSSGEDDGSDGGT
jgi:hypothetical protein